MNEEFDSQFNALLEKYTELLTGETDQDLQAKVQYYILYTYIAKSMPPLAKHWNEKYPEAKNELMDIIKEIKQLNDAKRSEQTDK
ncbi:DUF2573 family protein [Bacillus sp. CECT 9360]|uniref:DUF2573 family protein n=1 Tax=Bacillus sp. CECT 9360 TaxID=2845821 RepID=UPI001E347D4F|nr:DUF2573 family protein [Bacillus sp. CECT 9360]CAH0344692.1 hypothetical protein BCI9360_00955 [Bacillus sp. CECT 9360]